MTQFMMLVGIAGSGKSTIAEKISNSAVYLSSDKLREELLGDENNQEKNSDIFVEMAKRTKEALQAGFDVVYDATNISRKKRRGLLQQLPKNVTKRVIYMATEMDVIKYQNENRDRVVPPEVIDRMYKNMQVPIYSEGWDDIQFIIPKLTKFSESVSETIRGMVLTNPYEDEIMDKLSLYFREFKDILDMPQDSTYHSFSVSRHTYYVYKEVFDNYWEHDRELMLWVALLHDTGKAFCKSFYNRKGEKVRYANFIGHEHVSAQLAVHVMRRLNFDMETIRKATLLIQFHMYLLDQKANRTKLLNQVGQDMFDRLEFLRNADTLAH
ncbi:polynucleotide kinase [Bacillus phage vB_BanS_Skywalker]|uniref:AAA family ATPase domain-containing protein n=2 Tax=Tsamsavirus TaxID=3044849 RepID=A0AAE8YV54_9CAUD|nr:polynucleotide kinase [Bacillus phage vB_BanS_Skywalker]YP_010681043.1 polynucleotide kinase [Bacillus phage vB_BanS_MrDarsey]UGO47979.1 AAA family ATPase domain-containing protein [Bacillus phage vB_BanS_MrDarsey]UGO51278.1 AAA family ATPase domain-containing protein [Bacillus phage vB_BanS_Skywalker]